MAKAELNKKTSELLITVSTKGEIWKQEQEKAFKALSASLSLKGFRKGQVPTEIARKTIGQTEIFTKALQSTLDILAKDAAKEIKDDVIVLDSPTYKVEKVSGDELEVTFVYPIYPEVTLGNYKDVKTEYKENKVEEKQIEDELTKIIESRTKLVDKTGKLAKGDQAIFDFEGFVEDKPFEGGKAHNYELEIGSGQFIAGFEDQMIGMEIGDEKDIKVTFPTEYHVDYLAGKPSVFKIKLNAIKAKEKVEMTDALAAELNIPNVKTVAELKKYIRSVFEQQALQEARSAFQAGTFAELRKSIEVVIPVGLIVREMQNQQAAFNEQLKKQGLDFKRYSEMSGQTQEQLNSQFRAMAENKLKDALIFAEIAKAEKIEITEADYEAAYVKYAGIYGQTPEGVKGVISKAQLQIPLTNDKVLDVLIKASKK